MLPQPVPIPGTTQTTREVTLDRDRGYALYTITWTGRGTGRRLLLVAGNRSIPFQIWHKTSPAPDGDVYITQYIAPALFGPATNFDRMIGLSSYTFTGAQEKEDLLKIAAEAVLVLTCENFQKYLDEDGRVKVSASDDPPAGMYTRSSFNYPTKS